MPLKASVAFSLVEPKRRAEWRRWLERNHSTYPGIKLILHKKNSDKPRMTYDEAVEEALCFGWIDGKPNTLDETRYILHFNPRKPGSVWSQRNRGRVKRMIQSGLMTSAGLSKIKAAKKDGSWWSLDRVDAKFHRIWKKLCWQTSRLMDTSSRSPVRPEGSFSSGSKAPSAPRRERRGSKRLSPRLPQISGQTTIGDRYPTHKSPTTI